MQTPTAKEGNDTRSFWQRLSGARETQPEAELFGPRGKLPPRGEPDTGRDTALRWLVGIIVVGLILRLAVPRGIWLDEAISVYQAHLGLGEMFENIFYGDRHPPLHHIALWLTIRVIGDGELAVRLPSLIAGTLVIPALYGLGRELYDRRTGLIAAAFGAASPLLIWYAQEARMYAFVALFGLLALLTQVRVIRNPSMKSWALYILATAALLWSHYFGLLLIGVQQLIFVAILIQRRRAQEPTKALAVGFGYSIVVLLLQLLPLLAFAGGQFDSTGAAAGSPEGTIEPLSFYAVMANMAWALWGYHSDGVTQLLAAMWPLFLLLSLLLLGRGGSRQTIALGIAAVSPIVLLIVVAVFDRELFEVRYFLIAVPLLFLLAARLVTGWIRNPRGRALVVSGVILTLLLGLIDQQTNDDNPRLFGFRGAIEEIEASAGPKSVVIYEPPDMRYVLEYYAPELKIQPLNRTNPRRVKGSPLFVLTSFQDNKAFFDRTNKVVGQLDFFRKKTRRFRTPQTVVEEFR
jgi:Dolichyl-phosphate-mannose-protein mannosyltransferase